MRTKIFITGLASLAIGVLISMALQTSPVAQLGYNAAEGMQSDYVSSANASSTVGYQVRGGQGLLGSVLILKSSTAAFSVYDGAGTATTTASLIATFPATSTVGSYPFDVSVRSGIVLNLPAAFDGQVVITHK